MPKLRLHLDADTSNKALHTTLIKRNYDVTRTPNEWIELDASDEAQLLGAIAQERCIFTFNIRDFLALAEQYPQHYGILLAAQKSWTLSSLVITLDQVLSQVDAAEVMGQVRWLNDWRK